MVQELELLYLENDIMNAVLKFGQARLSPPTIDQIASEAALSTPQSYFDNVVNEYGAKKRYFGRWVK